MNRNKRNYKASYIDLNIFDNDFNGGAHILSRGQ